MSQRQREGLHAHAPCALYWIGRLYLFHVVQAIDTVVSWLNISHLDRVWFRRPSLKTWQYPGQYNWADAWTLHFQIQIVDKLGSGYGSDDAPGFVIPCQCDAQTRRTSWDFHLVSINLTGNVGPVFDNATLRDDVARSDGID